MPPVNYNTNQYLGQQLAQMKQQISALQAQQTQFVVDASNVCQAIVGNVAALPSGAASGYTGFGLVSFQSKNTGWTAPSLVNSWANRGGVANAGYLKDPLGFVHLRGQINGGTSQTTAFTLPAGYRPGAADVYGCGAFDASGNPLTAYVAISAAGVVMPAYSGTILALTLGGITFLAEN